jgi:hypothetical protein
MAALETWCSMILSSGQSGAGPLCVSIIIEQPAKSATAQTLTNPDRILTRTPSAGSAGAVRELVIALLAVIPSM